MIAMNITCAGESSGVRNQSSSLHIEGTAQGTHVGIVLAQQSTKIEM